MDFRVMLYRQCVAGSGVPREGLQEVGNDQGLLPCLQEEEGRPRGKEYSSKRTEKRLPQH